MANTTWNIYNFRLNVIDILLKNNFKVYVIAPVDKYIHYKERYNEITHVPLKKLSRDSVNPIKDILLTIELNGIYKKIKPDIILHYTVKPNIFGGIAAKLSKIQSIAVITGLGYAFIHNGYVRKITEQLYKYTSSIHETIIFENNDDRELFENSHLIKSGFGVSIKGCGVDTKHFKFKKSKRKNDKVVFTFIGRLIYDKGVNEFVQAAKLIRQKYDNVEFWLVGEIDKHNPAAVRNKDLVNWVREKTVIYHGSINDVRSFIANSSCIVLPSYREGLSRVLMEAASMSIPIITSDTAGCREVVEEGLNGFLVPIKDVEKLADSMESFLSLSNEKRNEMGKYGRAKVLKEFDDKIIAQNILDIINKALDAS